MKDKRSVLETIERRRIIPVVRSTSEDEALSVCDSVLDGGLSVLEITLTTPGAVDLISLMAAREKGILVGAGTVMTGDEAEKCIAGGARFVVNPAFDPGVAGVCLEAGVLCVSGALTPTEIRAVFEAGSDVAKIFPVNAVGGPAYLRSILAVYPGAKLIPTGGITIENAAAHLEAGVSAVGIGGNITNGNPDQIKRNCRTLLENCRQFISEVR